MKFTWFQSAWADRLEKLLAAERAEMEKWFEEHPSLERGKKSASESERES